MLLTVFGVASKKSLRTPVLTHTKIYIFKFHKIKLKHFKKFPKFRTFLPGLSLAALCRMTVSSPCVTSLRTGRLLAQSKISVPRFKRSITNGRIPRITSTPELSMKIAAHLST